MQRREIPPEVLGGDPLGDKAYRQRINAWVEQQWSDKDRLIDELLRRAQSVAGSASSSDRRRGISVPELRSRRIPFCQGR